MEIAKEGLIPARTLKEILQVNLSEEETAIKLYRSILHAVGQEGEILYETVEEILKDEQEHKEELERLKE
jgi:bacterioferritin (cytochrome b1)